MRKLLWVVFTILVAVISVGAIAAQKQQTLRAQKLNQLSNDIWCRQKISETYPSYPIITFLGNVTKLTRLAISQGHGDATWVNSTAGPQTEYYRFFEVSKRAEDPNNWDPSIFASGFITSELKVYDAPVGPMPPGP